MTDGINVPSRGSKTTEELIAAFRERVQFLEEYRAAGDHDKMCEEILDYIRDHCARR